MNYDATVLMASGLPVPRAFEPPPLFLTILFQNLSSEPKSNQSLSGEPNKTAKKHEMEGNNGNQEGASAEMNRTATKEPQSSEPVK